MGRIAGRLGAVTALLAVAALTNRVDATGCQDAQARSEAKPAGQGFVARKRTGRDATEAFNSVAGQIATSEIDTRRQSLGQPTLAQEAQKRMGNGPDAPCSR